MLTELATNIERVMKNSQLIFMKDSVKVDENIFKLIEGLTKSIGSQFSFDYELRFNAVCKLIEEIKEMTLSKYVQCTKCNTHCLSMSGLIKYCCFCIWKTIGAREHKPIEYCFLCDQRGTPPYFIAEMEEAGYFDCRDKGALCIQDECSYKAKCDLTE